MELLATQTQSLESLCLEYISFPDDDDDTTEEALRELVVRMSDLVEDGKINGSDDEDITMDGVDTPPTKEPKHSFAILPRLESLTIIGNKKYGPMSYFGPCFVKMMDVRSLYSKLKVSLSFIRSEEAMPFATKMWLDNHDMDIFM